MVYEQIYHFLSLHLWKMLSSCYYRNMGEMENIDVYNYLIVVLFLLCSSHNCDLSVLLFFICSAGVGRSGTVMAIDFCLQQIEKERVGNVRGFVSKMRDQRNYMVQTKVSFA